jgi:hypothetical protein
MSLINQLNATTQYFWLQTEPEDIVNKASALLWKLMGLALERDNWTVKPHEIVDGGLKVKVPLEFASSNSGSYGKNTVINQSKKDIIDAARFRWAGVYGSNTLNLDDLTQNTGEEALISLTRQYMNSIIKSARTNMADQVIAAAADDYSINGLGDLFNTTTSTEYGSIDEDEMPSWKANVITTVEAISFEVLQKIFRQVGFGDNAANLPDFCCTTQTLKDGYERTLQTQQRFRDSKMVDAGWENILFRGAPVVADTRYSTGVFDALNLRTLSLRSHKDYNFTTPEWIAKEEGGQPDTITANTRWRGNLYCTNRQMNVRHTGLTEPA